MANTKKQPETAKDACAPRATDIDAQLRTLRAALATHRRQQKANPTNWSLELGHLQDILQEAIDVFGTMGIR
jgi:hypothetical protein